MSTKDDDDMGWGLIIMLFIGLIVWGIYEYVTMVDYSFNYNGQTLTTTGGTTAKGQRSDGKREYLDYFGPTQQVLMHTLIDQTRQNANSTDSSAKEKKLWINASNKLCSDKEFDAFGTKIDWIGRVSSISMQDDGDITVYLAFSNDNKVVDTIQTSHYSFEVWENLLLSLNKDDYVQFSGVFKRGNRSENECLKASTLFSDSTPELIDKTYTFDLHSLAKIELTEISS